MCFREENFKFKQIYCDIPTGFGDISQRYIDFAGMDDSITITEEDSIDITPDTSMMDTELSAPDLPDYRSLAHFSDEAKELLGDVVFDESSRRYKLEAIVVDNPEMTIYQSSDDFLIYVYKVSSSQRAAYLKAFEYLMGYDNVQRVVLPIAILDEPYIGYIASKLNGYMTLEEHLMNCLLDDEDFEQYYKDTDGLFKRYKIASLMAKFLEEIHKAGYFIGDILPTEILVSPKKDSIVFMNANRLMRLPRHDYNETENLFVAPELKERCWRFDSLTDTYALAKIIRFMLFPVLKKDVPADVVDMFGDANVVRLLLSDSCIEDRYERCSLSEIRDTCLIASKRLHRCHYCHGWFLAHLDSEEECPWCNSEASQLAGAKFFEYTVSGDIDSGSNAVTSYTTEMGEMIFKPGKQTIDYRQMINGTVDTLEKIPIAGIRYYPDGSITLVNLTDDKLGHTYMDGERKVTEWIAPKADKDVEIEVYRGKSRIFYKEDDLSQHGFEETKVYQFFTIH